MFENFFLKKVSVRLLVLNNCAGNQLINFQIFFRSQNISRFKQFI